MRQRNILTSVQSGSLHAIQLGNSITLTIFTPRLFKIMGRAALQRLTVQMRKKMLTITVRKTLDRYSVLFFNVLML